LILISNNLPTVQKSQLEYFAMLAGIKNIPYNGNNTELGSACGKFFRVSCLGIINPGDSDILEKSKEKTATK
jgi:large subunit ribosomal protein L30e